MAEDERHDRNLFGGQSPPDENHPHVGGRDHCDSVLAGFKALGVNAECWHGDSKNPPNECRCRRCLTEASIEINRMVVCAECGNKRCPHANDHRNECTGSNEPGQPGSAYAHLSSKDGLAALSEKPNPDAEFPSGMCGSHLKCGSCPSDFICYMKAKAEQEFIAKRGKA